MDGVCPESVSLCLRPLKDFIEHLACTFVDAASTSIPSNTLLDSQMATAAVELQKDARKLL